MTDTIKATLSRQQVSQAEENYARQLAQEAAQKGLQATAAPHHLEVVTTPPVGRQRHHCRAARRLPGHLQSLPDEQGRQAAVRANRRRVRHPPGGRRHAGPTRPRLPNGRTTSSKTTATSSFPGLLNAKTQQLADKAKATGDLAKAAKDMGATVKTSDLVGETAQVPDFGAVGQIAPQLFNMAVGASQRPHQRRPYRRGGQNRTTSSSPLPRKFSSILTRPASRSSTSGATMPSISSSSNMTNDFKKHNLIRYNPKALTPASGE